MKRFLTVFLCIVMLVSMCPAVLAADEGTVYYVDSTNGSDDNSGRSASSAWKTLAKAASNVYAEGDKILLKAGSIFDGSFTAKGSGTAQTPITFGAYGDTQTLGKPIVRTNADVILFRLHNVSDWLVENIEFTAPNGKGMYITADGDGMTTDITVQDCVFHDNSHDNIRFITNSIYDNFTKNRNCTANINRTGLRKKAQTPFLYSGNTAIPIQFPHSILMRLKICKMDSVVVVFFSSPETSSTICPLSSIKRRVPYSAA